MLATTLASERRNITELPLLSCTIIMPTPGFEKWDNTEKDNGNDDEFDEDNNHRHKITR